MAKPVRLPALVLTLACIAPVSAQTIAPADYLPLAADPQWLLARVSGDGPAQIRITRTSVNPVAGGVRYELELPFDDGTTHARFELADDGTLTLRALDLDLDDLLPDLPFDPEASGVLQLAPPALIGAAMLEPGNARNTTPVDTSFEATVETRLGDVEVTIDVTGAVTATWLTQGAVDTPAGRFDDVVGLSLQVQLALFEDEFDGDGATDETLDFVLARDVGFVEVRVDGSTYRLLRAIVDGKPIGEFAQFEDVTGLRFGVPPLLALDGRSSSAAAGGDVALTDARLSHTLAGVATLEGTLDHPLASGLAVRLTGKGKMRADGTLHLKLRGKTEAAGQTIVLTVNDVLTASTAAIALVVKAGTSEGSIDLGIAPVVATEVDVGLDGFVDQSTGAGNKRRLRSDGVLRLGELEYPIAADEKLVLKKDGRHVHVYRFRQSVDDPVVLKVKAISTSAADFAVQRVRPRLFKWRVPKRSVGEVSADVVAPDDGSGGSE